MGRELEAVAPTERPEVCRAWGRREGVAVALAGLVEVVAMAVETEVASPASPVGMSTCHR